MNTFNRHRLEWITGMVFLCVAVPFNLQLLTGSNLNTIFAAHDEYLTVRQVYSILHPLSLKHFVMAVISGEKLYYGRVMFYLDALIAWLPYTLWGLKGMVFSIRMAHALLVVFPLFILGRTFIKTSWIRLAFYLFSITGIYTLYFTMIPKPEPWQMLFLAIFLWKWKAAEYRSGWHFFWLGLSYGAKFNVLFFVLCAFTVAIFQEFATGVNFRSVIKKKLRSFAAFMGGFVTAIPCLILSPIKPVFFKTYLEHTFLYSATPDDDAKVNVFSWLREGYGYYYWGTNIITPVILLLILILIIVTIRRFISNKVADDRIIILFSGICLFVPIVFFTHRIWPHYLWEAHVFWLLLFAVEIEKGFGKSRVWSVGLAFVTIPFLCYNGLMFIRNGIGPLQGLDKKYEADIRSWEQASQFIHTQINEGIIAQDKGVFYPFEEYIRLRPYHPFQSARPVSKGIIFDWEYALETHLQGDTANYLIVSKAALYQNKNNLLTELRENYWKADVSEFSSNPDQHFGNVFVFGRKH